MLTTTLNRIREHSPCEDGWVKLLKGLGKTEADDDPLSYATIMEINGLDDALWCCRAEPQYSKTWRLFAVYCAKQVLHLLKDDRSLKAIDMAECHANGLTPDSELHAAWEGAWDVSWAYVKHSTSSKLTRANYHAISAARYSAWSEAYDAAYNASIHTVSALAYLTEGMSTHTTVKAQKAKFIELLNREDI